METIEEKCQKVIDKGPSLPSSTKGVIYRWEWYGEPRSLNCEKQFVKKHPMAEEYARHLISPFIIVDKLIRDADKVECLTSNCSYIRRCKQWFIDNEEER